MRLLNLRSIWLWAVAIWCLRGSCVGANLAVNIGPADPTAIDVLYPGIGSTISTTTDAPTLVVVTIAGRNYGTDPAAGNPRWGLAVGPAPGGGSHDGFVVAGGFAPATPGSTQNPAGTEASYISITLSNVQPNTLFQNVSVELQAMSGLNVANAWGAVNIGGFSDWSVATLSNSGRNLTLDLADFSWTAGGPLEIRLYGVTSPVAGAFREVRVRGRLTASPAVPEPHLVLLLGLTVIGLHCLRRRPFSGAQ